MVCLNMAIKQAQLFENNIITAKFERQVRDRNKVLQQAHFC